LEELPASVLIGPAGLTAEHAESAARPSAATEIITTKDTKGRKIWLMVRDYKMFPAKALRREEEEVIKGVA
jgi:hypothetical protein